jgi:protein-S-isoprenylcysteine O-methyltransferase Ste14
MARLVAYAAIAALIFLAAPAAAGWPYLAHPAPWLGFALGVVTLASQPALTPIEALTDPQDRRSAVLIFVAVVVANVGSVLQFAWRPTVAPPPSSLLVVFGLAIAVAGMALRLWAIRTLGRFFTSSVTVQEGQPVLTTGPYAAMRHPSYTGSILTVLGMAIALRSPLGLVLVATVVVPAYLYRIRVEERTMLTGLGDDYAAYRARTPALVPAWRSARTADSP